MALVQSPFVLYILFSMHCTVPNMHAKQQNHQQKKKTVKVKKKRKKILLALEIKLFSIATTDNLFTKQNYCLHAQWRSNTKYSVSENTVYSLCKHNNAPYTDFLRK